MVTMLLTVQTYIIDIIDVIVKEWRGKWEDRREAKGGGRSEACLDIQSQFRRLVCK